MNATRWTASEKKIARRAFDAALDRALSKALTEFKVRAAAATTPDEMWDIGDDLYRRRKEIDRTFDYRYSQLDMVFAVLIEQGLLDEEELSGLSDEKLYEIRRALDWRKKRSAP